jgi:hypothetical protein
MGDSWEDDDFEVPPLPGVGSLSVPKWNDDEEDLLEQEANQKIATPKPTAAAIEAARLRAIEDEKALQTKIQLALLEKETPEERRAREKKQVEDADNDLAGELFGSSIKENSKQKSADSVTVPKGIASTVLKTKQDHQNFGLTVSQKLAESSAFNIVAFYKSLSKVLETRAIGSEVLEELLVDLKRIKEDKLKIEKPAKQANTKKSIKEIRKVEQNHADKYGTASKNSDLDKYDHYAALEDDYM